MTSLLDIKPLNIRESCLNFFPVPSYQISCRFVYCNDGTTHTLVAYWVAVPRTGQKDLQMQVHNACVKDLKNNRRTEGKGRL